jgi:hypothetical protein
MHQSGPSTGTTVLHDSKDRIIHRAFLFRQQGQGIIPPLSAREYHLLEYADDLELSKRQHSTDLFSIFKSENVCNQKSSFRLHT